MHDKFVCKKFITENQWETDCHNLIKIVYEHSMDSGQTPFPTLFSFSQHTHTHTHTHVCLKSKSELMSMTGVQWVHSECDIIV